MINPRPVLREADFRKSSYSDPDRDCVQVARGSSWAAVRDSKTTFDSREDTRLMFTAQQFDTFLTQYRCANS